MESRDEQVEAEPTAGSEAQPLADAQPVQADAPESLNAASAAAGETAGEAVEPAATAEPASDEAAPAAPANGEALSASPQPAAMPAAEPAALPEDVTAEAEVPVVEAAEPGPEVAPDVVAEVADAPPAEATPAAASEALAQAGDSAPAEATPAAEPAALPEDVTAEAEAPAVEAAEPAPPAAPVKPASPFKRGQVIDGTVLVTSPTVVRMDLGEGHEGVIPGRELERMSREQIEHLQPGAVMAVYVVNPNDHEGNIRLSVTHAQEELDWRKAEACLKGQEVVESQIAGYNKGGLIVRFGRVRGFVPQSQISGARRSAGGSTPEERWSGMVNQPISVKVIEVDRSRNRLILSERAAAREQREARKDGLIRELRVGEVREGHVVSLVDFGAFVDIGGAEGLVHLTEISWQHVTHPREALKMGQEVRVEVISVDPERKRIGLSIRRQAADPWDTVAIDYKVGQLVQGLVTKLTNFGAFARLVAAPEIEGLIHISELAEQRVTHPREIVSEGETLTLRVVKMDVAARRLGLSLKAVNSAEYLDQDWLA